MRRHTLLPVPSSLLLALLLAGCSGSGPAGPEGDGPAPPASPRRVVITSGPTEVRQGDVHQYGAELRSADGTSDPDASVVWSVVPSTAGEITSDGRFVGYDPGDARIVAVADGADAEPDTLDVTIGARGLSGSFEIVGKGGVDPSVSTTDLWVHPGPAAEHVYTGTFDRRLYVWDVSDPASPVRIDSLVAPAHIGRTVNDVKVRSDGSLGVITHEGSGGISLLDLTDPARPEVITRFSDGISDAHNVWIEGDYVYTAHAGTEPVRIIDVSDPDAPSVVAAYETGSSIPHDVHVRDGLAFVSYWNEGLVILDVGNGVAGGSPTNPVEVTRVEIEGGQVHNAWYWPAANYVFVGQEDFDRPGLMYVVDVRDLSDPEVVADFGLSPDPPHNFWLDEERAILYMAWYSRGIRALDVSGELLGDLTKQGREIAGIEFSESARCSGTRTGSCVWAPQLHDGLVYASDVVNGLWVLRPSF